MSELEIPEQLKRNFVLDTIPTDFYIEFTKYFADYFKDEAKNTRIRLISQNGFKYQMSLVLVSVYRHNREILCYDFPSDSVKFMELKDIEFKKKTNRLYERVNFTMNCGNQTIRAGLYSWWDLPNPGENGGT